MTEHDILLAVQKQVNGLVAEKAALQQQIDGLVDERNSLRLAAERARKLLASGRTVGNNWQQNALDAEAIIADALGL